MTVLAWILQIFLAAAFLIAGVVKLVRPKPALVGMGLTWADDFSDRAVKGIGAVELLGALGLILPAVTGIAPVLVPIAALGLAVTMGLAARVHLRRKEPIVPTLVLGVLALALAVIRFAVPA